MDTNLNIAWIQGKCDKDAYFISDKEICLKCGSFLRICSVDAFSDVPFQGPPGNILCFSCDYKLSLIAVSSQDSYIYILDYPKFEGKSKWKTSKNSSFIQLSFADDDYLLGLENSPSFNITLWNWRKAAKLEVISHSFPLENSFMCYMSINPEFRKTFVFQQLDKLYFYDIEDICEKVNLKQTAVYLPVMEDKVGITSLDEKQIESLTYFDKMQHVEWGIHAELLHEISLKVICSDLSEREIVQFYDFLTNQERLKATCHCWLKNKKLVIACLNGTILFVESGVLPVKIIYHSTKSKSNDNNYITSMVLNENALYVAQKNGDIFIVQNIEQWDIAKIISIEESPLQMKFSPDYANILVTNYNSSILYIELQNSNNISYLSSCTNDSRIVGIFVANADHLITAKSNGVFETWEIKTGVSVFEFQLRESIELMVGSPSSMLIFVSGSNSYLYSIAFTNVRCFKIVHITRPSEKPVTIIKCDSYGRFAVFATADQYIFIYRILPSKGLKLLGYIPMKYSVKDLAIFSKGDQNVTFVSIISDYSSDKSCIINVEIPADFINTYERFWEDKSGKIRDKLFKMKENFLQTLCCSAVIHHLNGLLLCLPDEKKILKVPFESFGAINYQTEDNYETLSDFIDSRISLSSSHNMLAFIDKVGNVCVRNSDNFNILYSHNFKSESCITTSVAFSERYMFLQGYEGIIVCCAITPTTGAEIMPWTSFCVEKEKEENEIFQDMRSQIKSEFSPWITEQLLRLNHDVIQELETKRKELEENLQDLKRQTQVIADENYSMPEEFQIASTEFIFDEQMKEDILKERQEEVEMHSSSTEEKLNNATKGISRIRKECIENMVAKGKILKPFKQGRLLFNYSLSGMSDKDKSRIYYCYKKIQLEKCLQKLKQTKEVEEEEEDLFEEKLKFDEPEEAEMKENIGKHLRKQPFQLQSREEKIDYIFTLKYILFKKRLAFNRLFNNVANLRKDTFGKIKENNVRIKEISLMISEEQNILELEDDDDEDFLFKVTEDEVANTSNLLLKKELVEPKSLAEEFLMDEWLLKRKSSSTQKQQLRLKKDHIDRLKKEVDKKLKTIQGLAYNYDKIHDQLVEEKLLWDLDVNKDELQLFLLSFSVANFTSLKKREAYYKNLIKTMEDKCNDIIPQIKEIENAIHNAKEKIRRLENETFEIDEEVQNICKKSRNKQAFIEAYGNRPKIVSNVLPLDPYRNDEAKKTISHNLLDELDKIPNKPQKVPLPLWKQLCSFRRKKFAMENETNKTTSEIAFLRNYLQRLKTLSNSMMEEILEKKTDFEMMHLMRIRSNFETPMVLSVSDSQMHMEYPDDLDFRQALFLKKLHIDALNRMISNSGSHKLEAVEKIAMAHYQIEKIEAKIRIDKLKIRDMGKEIEVIKGIPLTKDVQKIIQDPKGFSLQGKIDALEKSKQMEMNEIKKQMNQINERIAGIEKKKNILRRSMNEKRRDIERLKGDIAELYKIGRLTNNAI